MCTVTLMHSVTFGLSYLGVHDIKLTFFPTKTTLYITVLYKNPPGITPI